MIKRQEQKHKIIEMLANEGLPDDYLRPFK